MKRKLTVSIGIGCVIFLLTYPVQELSAQSQKYGKVDFSVSCNEQVQADFDRAMAMLHNMMYVTARDRFDQITQKDPNCAMAYWGIATTLFQPLWGTRPSEEDLQQGWELSSKAIELAESGREKMLAESTAAFFRDPEATDFWPRIERWTAGVKTAYEAYPDDPDITALYGLSLLTLAQRADDRNPLHDEAEALLREVYEENPRHPGAIHYTIHATDVDGRAENALDIVEAYGKIAPDVPHALHMPTHIYVRLGDWAEVINWNKKSAEAALNHPVGNAVSHHYAHAIDYLVYAYLQQGEDEKAESIAEKVWSRDPHQASFIAAFHMAAIPARMAVERHDWEEAAELKPRSPDYLPWDASPWAEGLTWFARGLGSIHTDNLEMANEAEEKLRILRDNAKSSGADDMASYIEIDRCILAGWIAHANNENDKAIALIQSAAELEDKIEKHPVTPGALLPANEALGNLLLDLDRPAEALEAYKASDAIWPGRYNTLLGAARAADKAGDKLVAEEYYQRLLTTAGNSERSDIKEARSFASEK